MGRIVVVVAAAALGLAIGVGVHSVLPEPAIPLRSADAATPAVATASLDVFQRTQRASDRPAVALHSAVVASSLRGLAVEPQTHDTLYAAMDAAGQICLVRVRAPSFTATCGSRSVFLRAGLAMRWTDVVIDVHDQTANGAGRAVTVSAEWLGPSGRVTLEVVR